MTRVYTTHRYVYSILPFYTNIITLLLIGDIHIDAYTNAKSSNGTVLISFAATFKHIRFYDLYKHYKRIKEVINVPFHSDAFFFKYEVARLR